MMNEKASAAMRAFLEAMGLDLAARGMEKTPERVTEMFELLFSGCTEDAGAAWGELFETSAQGLTGVQHIPFYSLCEHHLVPFFGEVHIAYLPKDGKIAGFSKFVHVVNLLARRPQLQERFTREIADAVLEGLSAEGVLVICEARQLCMMMRGELAPETRTLTSEAGGRLVSDTTLRKEAWELLLRGMKG